MALDSYTNLKAEIADWLDRDDLTARIDTFIDLTEAKLAREIRVRAMLRRADAAPPRQRDTSRCRPVIGA